MESLSKQILVAFKEHDVVALSFIEGVCYSGFVLSKGVAETRFLCALEFAHVARELLETKERKVGTRNDLTSLEKRKPIPNPVV